ncbi:MAG: aldo/keto reductase [Myxococcales bacterium]|nr:MAG: aldo/keto reductase [Myxococcales bacterium]
MSQELLRRGEKEPMQYRRFGKTNLALSVITLGGMRYEHGWDSPRDELPRRSIEQCRDIVKAAFDAGVNHIETAHGYVKSEGLYGKVLNEELRLPRDSYFLMTKGSPETADEMYRLVESQLKTLGTDYFDLYAWHGINTPRRYRAALHPGGPVEALKRLQEQGVIRHVGFSTHGSYQLIIDAISTGLFDFVNLHYYYFWQRNWGAVQLAAERDMGVFIISPNDKGGQLFDPPELLRELTAPLTPIQYNARFCLRSPHVHTLSFGMTELAHVEEMRGVLPVSVPLAPSEQATLHRLDARLALDPYAAYDGYELDDDPSGINIPEVLRFRRLLKCYDMLTFGRYRYNMARPGDEWFAGEFATDENLDKVRYDRAPPSIPLRRMLAETHDALFTGTSARRPASK